MQNKLVAIVETEFCVKRVRFVQIVEYTVDKKFVIKRRRHE